MQWTVTATLHHPPVLEYYHSTWVFCDWTPLGESESSLCISLLTTAISSHDTQQPGLAPGTLQELTKGMSHNISYISTVKYQSIFKLFCSNLKTSCVV